MGGFSSATFTADDGAPAKESDRHRSDSQGRDAKGTSSASGASLTRPTIDTYRAMSDEELITLLRTRETQVRQLRYVYETFHYEADKCFRTMVFDYHDKAMHLSQVHGKMQQSSLQITREALTKMREEQEMLNRDKRIVLLLSTVLTLIFWVWVRRHYIPRTELLNEPSTLDRTRSVSVTGAGSYNDNFFGSTRRSARSWETSWEKEVRERQEASVPQETAASGHGNNTPTADK